MASTGLTRGTWALASTADCGGSGVSQHELTCIGCQLSSIASLTLTFHYSCQSLLLEAAGMAPYPVAPSLQAAPAPATAAAGGALLSTLVWTLSPVLGVVWDNASATGSASALGWQLAAQSLVPGLPLLPLAAASGALRVQPAAASVSLLVQFPLASTYASTLLTPRVPWTQLLSNIIGLSGVLSLFGMAFGYFELLAAKTGGPAEEAEGAVHEKPEVPVAAHGQGGAAFDKFLVTNPLRGTSDSPLASAASSDAEARACAAQLWENFDALPPGWMWEERSQRFVSHDGRIMGDPREEKSVFVEAVADAVRSGHSLHAWRRATLAGTPFR